MFRAVQRTSLRGLGRASGLAFSVISSRFFGEG